MAARVEDVHESLAQARHGATIPRRVLLSVSDVQLAAQVLNVERRITAGDVAVGESAVQRGPLELTVDDVDLAVVEVGSVQEMRGADVARGEASVDRAVDRLEADFRESGKLSKGGLYRITDRRVPAGDRPGLRREDEHGRPGVRAVRHREVGRVAGAHDRLVDVEHLPGRLAARDVHLEGLEDRAAVDVAEVQLAQAPSARRHPKRTSVRRRGNAPGVDEGRVEIERDPDLVGNQIDLLK